MGRDEMRLDVDGWAETIVNLGPPLQALQVCIGEGTWMRSGCEA